MKLKHILLPAALGLAMLPMFGDDEQTAEPQKQQAQHPVQAEIHLLARSYGDSVVLRWAGEDYVTQRLLNETGVMVVRYNYTPGAGENFCDTLATNIKPWTQQQFEQHYPKSDSIALMGYGLLYTNSGLKPDQTKSAPGSIGSLYDIYQDQMMNLAMRVLVSEWRPDMADHMAMRFVDRTAKLGHEYEYIVRPVEYDTTATVIITPGILRVTNERYIKPQFNIQLGDSILGHCNARLWWENKGYSSYEIERRKAGDTRWKRLTSTPYWNMAPVEADDDSLDCSFGDVVPEPGDYEYRILGHDPFGELSRPSSVLKIHYADMQAPTAPDLVLVEIDRQDPKDLSKQVKATFHFEKDSIEGDFVGFRPLYYSSRKLQLETGKEQVEDAKEVAVDGREWRHLSKDILPPGTTTFTCDMTGFSTGMVVVAAYDTAQNVSYSIPRMVQIKDVKAPSPMRNFKAEVNAQDGTIHLTWEPDSVDDDIEYYEVTYANDTTHTFMLLNKGKLLTNEYTDTVAMDVNQKYIYYKVRAIDYSTNQGDDTPALQVIRPSRLIPQVPHLLNSMVDSLGIHMDWACSNEQVLDHHILLRRLEGQEQWDTLAVYNADSVKLAGDVVKVTDTPPYDRVHEYQYCMESFSYSGISSGHSLIFCVMYEGSRYLNIPLTLNGVYDAKADETILTWEVNNGQPLEGDWYFSLFRKGPHDDYHSFYISLPANKRERHSSMLVKGQTESYYLKVIYDDGRESHASNTVSVTATKPEE